jgi:prophage DNA circulation protein
MSGWLLDGVDLPVVDVQDDFAAAVAKHAFAYKNAQSLEYLGVEERSIKINCLFFGSRYDDHKDFLRAILSADKDSHELVHPAFGTLAGSIESVGSSYNENKRHVAISITFIVEGDGDDGSQLFGVSASIKADTQTAFSAGQETLKESFGDALKTDIGTEAGDLIETEIDTEVTLLDQFLTASQAARDYLSEIDDAIGTCEGYLTAVTAPADSFLNTIEYGSALPGRFVRVVNEALDRICANEGDSTTSPRAWLENLKSAYYAFASRFVNAEFNAADQVSDAVAMRYAFDCGAVYDEDNTRSLSLATIEGQPAFDVAGNRVVTESVPDIMTIDDLDETLYSAREMLQAAIDRDRSYEEPYKTMAKLLLDHVEIVRLNRERIVIRNIPTEMPLHTICQRYGLPIGYADRILAINPGIKNPSFVKGDIRIYA